MLSYIFSNAREEQHVQPLVDGSLELEQNPFNESIMA